MVDEVPVHIVADPECELHQEWPTKPDESARCPTCRRGRFKVTTSSGRIYDIDLDGGFWARSPRFYPHRIWQLQAGKEKVVPWKGEWEDRMPEIGEHMHVGDRDEWYVSMPIVSIEPWDGPEEP